MQANDSQTIKNRTFTFNIKARFTSKNIFLTIGYSLLVLTLYAVSFSSPMDDKGIFIRALTLINLVGIAAFYLQFPLVGRLKSLPLFKHIDWAISKHKKIGYWIGGIFFLHPLLIIAPKLQLSHADTWLAIKTVITAPELLTGIIAWVLMAIWIVFSAFKNKLPIRYESWRLVHSLGFIAIAIFATLHVTSVGSHGQLQPGFNTLFWGLCIFSISATIYNYVIKPIKLTKSPFEVVGINKLSSSDWQLTIKSKQQQPFYFEAGQFVWLNTQASPHNIDYHPFSISSTMDELPNISFIIRELGDYTKNLNTLEIGQTVFVDGPFGQMSLYDTKQSSAILFIAGGAGLGPMMSLLRQLYVNQDPRPIRFIYGNQLWQQMSMLDELNQFEREMQDFKSILVCNQELSDPNVYQGVIDLNILKKALSMNINKHECGVYLCGSKSMINSVTKDLSLLGINKNQLHFEQLSF